MKKLIFVAMVLALALMMVSSASADMNWWKVTVSGQAEVANDFHLSVQVNDIDNVSIIKDPCLSCTDVEIEITGEGTGTVDIDIRWIGGTVEQGADLEIAFSTTFAELVLVEGYWTLDEDFVATADLVYEWSPNSPIPSLTTYGLIALAVLIGLTGLWMYRRKRVATTA